MSLPRAGPPATTRALIKYLGSKRALVPLIVGAIDSLPDVEHVVDLFAGTSRVGHALKRRGYRVHANDSASYAATLARCYVEADREVWFERASELLAELDALPGEDGYVTETFCERSRYFQAENGRRIDRIRRAIAELDVEPQLEAVLLTALLQAADRVDSTAGVQMAYLKQWSPRSHRRLELRVPDLVERPSAGACRATCDDALAVARTTDADVAYLDPPYNQHKYLNNYHVWETIVRDDRPDTYGVACKRVDCRERRSPFNSSGRCADALEAVIAALDVRYVLLSFSDEGHIGLARLRSILGAHGVFREHAVERPRYVGARIGIHDGRGRRVGRVSHLRNKEHLFLLAKGDAPLPEGEWRPAPEDAATTQSPNV